MPYCKFILPTAPTQPVTMNMGMSMPSWYDITGLDERSNENCKGIEDSTQRLQDILHNEHTQNQLPYSRMVLAGFSQGGALSLYTGFQMTSVQQKLAGIVCMSGYLPAAAKFKITEGLQSTPVLHCHGTQDMLVRYDMALQTQTKLLELGVSSYQLKQYPIAHTVSMNEIQDVLQYLQQIIPNDTTFQITLQDPETMSVKQLKEAIKNAGISHRAVGFMEKREFVQLLQQYRSGL
jgi:lysophospholipase II